MKKQTRIGNVIVFGFFCLFVCGCDPPKREPPPTVSTTELMSDFVSDAYAAEQKYQYRRHVILTGKIGRIHIEESAHYVNQWEYTLRMQPEVIDGIPTEVYCYFNTSEASTLRHLSKGDTVKISGRLWSQPLSFSLEDTGTAGILQRGTYSGTDKTYYFVKLHDCYLVKRKR